MYDALDNKLTDPKTGVLSAHNKLLKKAYGLLVEVAGKNKNNIRIFPPLLDPDVHPTGKDLEGKTRYQLLKEFGVQLTKSFEVLQPDGVTILKKELENEASAFVIPQHMLDATIFKKAKAATYAYMKKHHPDVPIGALSIHDAENATAIYNVQFQKFYREEFVRVNINYDIIEAMLGSVKALPNKTDAQKESYKDLIEAIKTDGKYAKEVKTEALETVNTKKMFGFDNTKISENQEPTVDSGILSDDTKKAIDVKDNMIGNIAVKIADYRQKKIIHKQLQAVLDDNNISEESKVMVQHFKDNYADTNMEIDGFSSTDGILKRTGMTYRHNSNFINIVSEDVFSSMYPNIDATYNNAIAHEIDHFYLATVSRKKSGLDNHFNYVKRSIQEARKNFFDKETMKSIGDMKLEDLGNSSTRLIYMLYGKTDSTVYPKEMTVREFVSSNNDIVSTSAVYEFIAIMNQEPEFRQVVLNLLPKNNSLMSRIKEIISNIVKYISSSDVKVDSDVLDATLKDLMTSYVSKELELNGVDNHLSMLIEGKGLVEAYNGSAISGIENTADRTPIEEALAYRAYEGNIDSSSDPLTDTMTSLNEQSAVWLSNIFNEQDHNNVYSLVAESHESLKDISPQYKRLSGYITQTYEENPLLQQLVHYVNADTFDRADEKRKFITLSSNAEQEMHKITNDESLKLDSKIGSYAKSDKEKNHIYDVWANSGIYGAIEGGQLVSIAQGNTTLDEEIKKLEDDMSSREILKARELATILTDGVVSTGKVDVDYNTSQSFADKGTIEKYTQLTSLYSLKDIDGSVDSIQKMLKEDVTLYNELVKWNILMNQMNDVVYTESGIVGKKDPKNYRQNLITDTFQVPKEFAVISKRDLKTGSHSEAAGWKVLKKPEGEGLGLVYRDIGDQQSQSGSGTSVNYLQSDIIVPRKYDRNVNRKRDNVINATIGSEQRFKMILTTEQKKELGLVKDTAHSLVNTYARLNMIKDTEVIRTELLKDTFTEQVSSDATALELLNKVNDKSIDNPWFINLKKGILYDDLDPKIKSKYSIIKEPISSVGGFKYNVSLVRNDISPWLLGYKEANPFPDNPNLRKSVDVAKKVVSMMKIHWILNNPIKIVNDVISNETILLAKNVSVFKQLQYARDAIPMLKDIEDLRGEIIQAKIDYAHEPSVSNKKKLDRLNTRFQNHDLAFAVNNGFIQSLSTDVVMKNYNTISGLQKDIESMFSKVTRLENGELSGLGKAIMKFGNSGPRIEKLMGWAESVLPEDIHRVREFLIDSSARIEKMKDEKEVDKYFAQFFGSPDSEMTKLGSAATQYADIIPRIILYKHLKDVGKSEAEAVGEALETFIDYRVNMPKELKVLSDTGLILFPSFWMRIQKVILSLSTNNSASIAAALIASELYGDVTGGDGFPHIFDANIANRILDDRIFNTDAPTLLDVALPKVIQQIF